MATRKSAAKGRGPASPGDVDLSTHPLVAERKVDPSEIEPPPELTSLVGYIGPSRREGSIRLYQDLTFSNYYEIPSAAVVSTAPVNEEDENSPTHVQVAPDTKVEVVTVSVQSVEARYLGGSIAGGFYGAAAGAAGAQPAQPLCTNITTYMPSCVGAQGPAAGCAIVMTTMTCTFGGLAQTTVTGPEQFCTTYYTANPSHCAPQCNPNCIATVVTSHHAAAAQTFCTNITTHMPSCVGGAGPELAAAAARPCMTVVTANPTDCGVACRTVVTANPTDCGAQQFGAQAAGAGAAAGAFVTPQLCIVTRVPTQCGPICPAYYTANPTNCGPVLCLTIIWPTRIPCAVTRVPTQCFDPCFITRVPTRCFNPCGAVATHFPTCDVQVTVNVTVVGPLAAAAQPQAAAVPQAAAAAMCITLHTAVPSWCDPPVCPTVFTARPTGCG